MMTPTETSKTRAATTHVELVGDRDLVITRTFRAPPRVVFEAWTRPDLVKLWWAPKCQEVSMGKVEADVRAGGAWRYEMGTADGVIAFFGTYLEVAPPGRLVYTSVFEPMAHAGAVHVTVSFEDAGDGRTHVTSREIYPSKEAREAAVASGMEVGLRDTYEQLDALVAERASAS